MKKTKAPHPLRQLRDVLSKIERRKISQPTFAKMVGVSASYINAIESGARPLPLDIALACHLRGGIDWARLMSSKPRLASSLLFYYYPSRGERPEQRRIAVTFGRGLTRRAFAHLCKAQ